MLRQFKSFAALIALLGLVATATPILAANTLNLEVLDNGQPVAGARVEIVSSTGATQHLTNEEGRIVLSLEGVRYRVRVNDVAVGGIRTTTPELVTIELSN